MGISRTDAAIELVAKLEAIEIAEQFGIETGIEKALQRGIDIGHDRTLFPSLWEGHDSGYKQGIDEGISFLGKIVANLILSCAFDNDDQIAKAASVPVGFVRYARRRFLEFVVNERVASLKVEQR